MSDKQIPRDFIEKYASISDMGITQVVSLLDIQDRQDTKYSRVKTCEKLWNAATKATRAECDDKVKSIQAEIISVVDSFFDREKSRITVSCGGCTRMESEYALRLIVKMRQEIEQLNQRGEDGKNAENNR